jgi:hypothetical protein
MSIWENIPYIRYLTVLRFSQFHLSSIEYITITNKTFTNWCYRRQRVFRVYSFRTKTGLKMGIVYGCVISAQVSYYNA